MKEILNRASSPTPKFFRTLRNVGLALAAGGAVILASPVTLPAALITACGYFALAVGIISALSQVAVKDDE